MQTKLGVESSSICLQVIINCKLLTFQRNLYSINVFLQCEKRLILLIFYKIYDLYLKVLLDLVKIHFINFENKKLLLLPFFKKTQ